MSREASLREFESLYSRYFSSVVAFFLRHGFSRDVALDLAQDTFVRVFRGMGTYRGDGKWSFIEVTARRVALNKIRESQTARRSGSEVSLEGTPEVLTLPSDPLDAKPAEALLQRKEQVQQLRKAISELPGPLQRCLVLRVSGMKYTEIQKTMGISMDAVKSRLNEARKRLREKLVGHLVDDIGIDWPPEE